MDIWIIVKHDRVMNELVIRKYWQTAEDAEQVAEQFREDGLKCEVCRLTIGKKFDFVS